MANNAKDLLKLSEISGSILTAAGISDKAKKHLKDEDKIKAISEFIENFLIPAGSEFVNELIYRFLLIRGDSLGGSIRNLAGHLGEKKFSKILIRTLSIEEKEFSWLPPKTEIWKKSNYRNGDEIETDVKGLKWRNNDGRERVLIYNLTVPIVGKNIDFCLFNTSNCKKSFTLKNKSLLKDPNIYLAFGELKGGIDPAGADEHWKTANHALERIRKSFLEYNKTPFTFFVGAAIENSMAKELYNQLAENTLTNAANLTNWNQVISLSRWLINI